MHSVGGVNLTAVYIEMIPTIEFFMMKCTSCRNEWKREIHVQRNDCDISVSFVATSKFQNAPSAMAVDLGMVLNLNCVPRKIHG